MVRIAQGLVHLGKGTMTMNPYHSDRQLLSPVALAGLLATLVAALDCKTSTVSRLLSISPLSFDCQPPNFFRFILSAILGKSHYLLYCLVTAIHPRMLVTFDEELQPLPVSVRVGQVSTMQLFQSYLSAYFTLNLHPRTGLLMLRWSFSGVHKLCDNFKPPIRFSGVKQGLILEEEAEKSTYLNELDVRKPLVVSISHRSEELRLQPGLEYDNS